MTRDELIARLKEQKARKVVLTWNQFVTAFQALDAGKKADFLTALNGLDWKTANKVLADVVKTAKVALASAEVDAIVADNTITVDELLGIMN